MLQKLVRSPLRTGTAGANGPVQRGRSAWQPAALLAAVGLLPGTLAIEPASANQLPAVAALLPERLSETGLYEPGTLDVRAAHFSYTPQYPLWSDGASKRRWFSLPAGTAIDASDMDAWQFPVGTRLWKEFSHGRPVETRYIERLADGTWRYAAYVWAADGSDAYLAPGDGLAGLDVEGAPGGRYSIPSAEDCRACHEGGAVPVLGVSALQLSADRDPGAPNREATRPGDVDLAQLIGRGLLSKLPPDLPATQPRVRADSAIARAALGYLHGNCGHCHNARGTLADIGLVLAQDVAANANPDFALATAVGKPADSRVAGLDIRIVAGRPEQSQLVARMKSRNPYHQMPPLGTRIADGPAVLLVETWIQQLQTGEDTTQ